MPQAIGCLGEAAQGPHLAIATHIAATHAIVTQVTEGHHHPFTKGAIIPAPQQMPAGFVAL